ncbi:MFS transporter [Kineococcus sp. SYSU DK005]|uniref:MFS transporter n=1 Tax=Kineococcus sp. SYSU DK005 TaxID=3383126 RepID=UPI003D7E03C6
MSTATRHRPDHRPDRRTDRRPDRRPARRPAGASRPHGRGFVLVALVLAVGTAFSTVPTPLWSLYRAHEGFSTAAVTVAFAAYAVGVAVSLHLAGHVSDHLGRRRVLLPAVALELAAAVLLLTAGHGLAVLVAARVLTGLGVGLLTATATAHLAELHAAARPGAPGTRAGVVATAANFGGLALGPLAAGFLARFAPAPLTTSYAVFLVLLAGAAAALAAVPETVPARPGPYRWRPQRSTVPPAARGRWAALAALVFAAFAVFGLFTSLAPAFLARAGVSSTALTGLASAGVFTAAAVSQVVLGRLPAERQLGAGSALLAAGVGALAGGDLLASPALFAAGGLVAGSGAGVLLKGVLAVATALAPAGARGQAAAGVFLVAYLGLALPVLGIGAADAAGVGLTTSLLVLAGAVLAVLALARTALRRSTAGTAGHRPRRLAR